MKYFVNNELKEILESTSLFDVLVQMKIANQKGIAVAINNSVIPKSEWEKYKLNENDRVTIITATQGG